MTLVVPATRCSTLGDRAFPVSATRTWNALPSDVRAAPSLTTFRQKLKQTRFCNNFLISDSAPVTVYSGDSVTLMSALVVVVVVVIIIIINGHASFLRDFFIFPLPTCEPNPSTDFHAPGIYDVVLRKDVPLQ